MKAGAALAALLTACAGSQAAVSSAAPIVVPAADVEWGALNPARGDASPRAATLWGDRTGSGATGFLVRFVDGFESPPHIHNVTYRGVVIRGLVHNDDASAEPMWMPAGSYWTQPRGGPHITAARGETVAYIEIDEGPYLVRPVDQAFEDEERPVNVDASDLEWLDASSLGWSAPVQVATLWGEVGAERPRGMLLKLPAHSAAESRGRYHAVVIAGRLSQPSSLEPGSYLRSDGVARLACGEDESLVYVRAEGALELTPLPSSASSREDDPTHLSN
ncbi:MAG TPA: hypothetical protein DEF51_19255 [Myxococcales bacterium]|nr:hypothetical protein [Myxococcales bacterium]